MYYIYSDSKYYWPTFTRQFYFCYYTRTTGEITRLWLSLCSLRLLVYNCFVNKTKTKGAQKLKLIASILITLSYTMIVTVDLFPLKYLCRRKNKVVVQKQVNNIWSHYIYCYDCIKIVY